MMRSPQAHSLRQAGFTLIEVLAALVVLAMLLTLTGTALRVLANSAARGSKIIDRLDMVARGYAAMRKDLVRVERAVRTERNGDRFIFSGDGQGLSFVMIEPGYPTEPGSYLISYAVQRTEAGLGLVRARDVYDPKSKGPPRSRAESAEVTIIEGPYRYKFSYYERAGSRIGWVDRWTETRRMPELIRLEVESTTAGVPSPPPLLVRPRIDAEVTCVADARPAPRTIKAGNAEAPARHACTPRTAGLLEEAPPLGPIGQSQPGVSPLPGQVPR